MRYTYEYKKKCVEMYRKGKWPETPLGITKDGFHSMVRKWARAEVANGSEVLQHTGNNRRWTPEEKLELVSEVLAGASVLSVATNAGINPGVLYQWVRKYKILGYNGLVNKKKGKPPKEPNMKKENVGAENEYIKAENEVIKKEIALREEEEAARLKAKKQRSSKNSGKKDSN